MNRGSVVVSTLAAVAAVALLGGTTVRTASNSAIWFTPNAGSPDMLTLFTQPDQWSEARQRIGVFEFYQAQVLDQPPPPAFYLPNDFENLRSVGAFEKLTRQWHKQIAIEAAAVKPFLCTPDNTGMRTSILLTLRSINDVASAGGQVNRISMDSPFASGVLPECGGPDPGATIRRLGQYMRILRALEPGVAIGLSEPYPSLSAASLEEFLRLMVDNGIAPAFFHLDLDLNALQHNATYAGYDPVADMRRLDGLCKEKGIAFGYIFWGLSGDSDATYYAQVLDKIDLVKKTFGGWDSLPDDLVFQSFAESSTGAKTVPLNLPETSPYTHTHLIDEGWFLLRGYSPAGTGTPRH